MVVGEHKAVGTDDHAGAIAREVHHGLHNGIVGLVKLVVGQRITIALHLLIDCARQIIERPHALVGTSVKHREEGEKC